MVWFLSQKVSRKISQLNFNQSSVINNTMDLQWLQSKPLEWLNLEMVFYVSVLWLLLDPNNLIWWAESPYSFGLSIYAYLPQIVIFMDNNKNSIVQRLIFTMLQVCLPLLAQLNVHWNQYHYGKTSLDNCDVLLVHQTILLFPL